MKENQIPTWIYIWAFLMALLPTVFSLIVYFYPQGMFGEEVASTGNAIFAGAIGLYAARNVAEAVVTYYAIFKRSVDMLILAFMLRIVTDVFDTIHRYVASTLEIDFFITAFIEVAVTWYAAYKLNQLRD